MLGRSSASKLKVCENILALRGGCSFTHKIIFTIKDCGSLSSGVMEKMNARSEPFVISKISSDPIRKGFLKAKLNPNDLPCKDTFLFSD